MKAVIIGSTGLVGSCLLRVLLAKEEFTTVVSISRKPTGLTHPKLNEVIIKDLREIPDVAGDVYFCALGTTIKEAGSQARFRDVDYEAVVHFGRIAKAHNAQALAVVSAAGADPGSRIFYSRVKGEAERELKSLNMPTLLLFRPALLIGERAKFRFGERVFISMFRACQAFLPESIQRRLATSAQQLAETMVAEILTQREGVFVIQAKNI